MHSVLTTLSCTGFLGLVFGIVAFVVCGAVTWDSVAATVGAWMVALMTFVAAALLLFRDNLRRIRAIRRIRQVFTNRPGLSADDFRSGFAPQDQDIALTAREALARFYGIPEDRLHPNVDLWSDLAFSRVEPFAYAAVAGTVFPDAHKTGPFAFPTSRPETLGDLVRELAALRFRLDERRAKRDSSE